MSSTEVEFDQNLKDRYAAKIKPIQFTSERSTLRRLRRFKEAVIEWGLFLAAFSSVLVTIGVAGTFVVESLPFFFHVSLTEFLTGSVWSPAFADPQFGILPLVCGTLLTTVVALSVAIPMGTIAAVFLSEYASPALRETVKPILELLSAVPTVVYGYFALLLVTPLLQMLMPELKGFNVLSAGLVMGLMIVPYISSLSEDAMRAVPGALREGSYAMGATRFQTATRVVYPAAFSGITSAYILGISRAVGETMIVAIAAGGEARITLNPLDPAMTITAFIVQVSGGDIPHGSISYISIYAAGITLLLITLIFNIFGFWLKKRYREAY